MTLDPDVARLLREEAHRRRRPFQDVVNEAIRRGLAPTSGATAAGRYRLRPHKTTLRPGIDAVGLNRLVDELEDDAVVAELRRRR
ncbi:MAG TPA: hypothetical protein VNL18_07385 [Gemmatimonadales bacterium]|nr:hypothetical protein [Gemmatimonadales bacterium]